MKNRSFLLALALLMLFSFFSLSTLLAQHSFSDEYNFLLSQTNDLLNKTQGWARQSMILRCLTIAVAIFGVAVSTLQKVDRPWSKNVTLVLGLIISGLTVVNTTAFDADYRTLKGNALQLHAEIVEAQYMLAGFDGASEADKQIYIQKIIDLTKKVYGTEEGMVTKRVSLELLPAAYALSTQPGWISNPPTDSFNDYFVGKGENPSLATAKDLAYNNAVDNAVRRLGPRPTATAITAADPLRKYVLSSSAIAQSYFSYDGVRRLYTYYVLLKINRKLTQPAFIKTVARPKS